ncbi:AzlC family ABC transporter permease [Actinomycetospora rhizophila]|uniref:AzlC family ABC transporter permease n=1 Tax=Actinomycetospora rhizophila TaxID=1416876 RepID=A0ABV9Z9R8_9PSEU
MSITERHTRSRTIRGGEVRTAVRDLAPVVLGLAPFALLIGVTAVRSGVGAGTGILSAPLLYGGSGQLTALTLMAGGAGLGAVLAAVGLVNARFLLYAAALEPRFRDQPRWFRWIAPHFVVDPTYAMVTRRRELSGADLDDPATFRRWWTAVGVGLGVAWTGLTAVGALLAPVLPTSAALDVAAPAMFLAMLVPQLRARPARAGAAAAAITAALAASLPAGLGLLCGIAAGLAAATLTDRSPS